MPREYVFASERAIDLADGVWAAAEQSLDWQMRSIWEGGAVQYCDAEGLVVLTVLHSTGVEAPGAAARLLAGGWGASNVFWTEAYGAAGDERADSLARTIAAEANAQLFIDGVLFDGALFNDVPNNDVPYTDVRYTGETE